MGQNNSARIIIPGTGLFNSHSLEVRGWDFVPGNDSQDEYRKQWQVNDLDGSKYTVTVSIRQHEDGAHVFIGDEWIGRASYIRQLSRIVKTLSTCTH